MTDAVHPSLDELSDLRAALLDGERQREMSSHVATCEQCEQATESLTEVETILTAAGSAPAPLPEGASVSLYAALGRASAERAADVASRAERRTETPRRQRSEPRLRRWATAAGAAAAVVLVGYAGIALVNSGSDSSSSSVSGGVAGAGSAPTGPAADRAAPQSLGSQPFGKSSAPALTPKTLPGYAARLVANRDLIDETATCGASVVDMPGQSSAAAIRWRGARALVVVDPAHHRAKVYSCRGDGVLFTTTY